MAIAVVPWHAFLLHPLLMSVAILFASQLQIEKRKLNTSISRHLGLRWQGIDLEIIGLLSLIYVMLFYIDGGDELSKKSAKMGVDALSRAKDLALPKPWWGIWVVGLYICLLAPITEEMLFRGVIMHELRMQGLSKTYAWLATSILFMIAHGRVGWTTSAFILILGLQFGWMRMKTGTLLVPIWAHILHNTLVFCTILYLLSSGLDLRNIQFVKTIKHYYLRS